MSATTILIGIGLLKVSLEIWLALSHRCRGAAALHAEQTEDEPADDAHLNRAHPDSEYQSGHLPSEEYACHAGSVSSIDDFRYPSNQDSTSFEPSSTMDSYGDDGWQ